ncbi:CDP-glucose 4,6-dehydratase [Roseovarius sp. EL26]|uniref:CDP-glucose 4,6-dehydratase n=1 Tax=Roseovarius sp. EL26 TaxID=2126672 RepID=UPI001C1F3C1A|nr:CDP-glucose 4,6-dehydratase [Roseovarius sp. EL26]
MKENFKGRRVLITGDTGFKGAWLSLWLHQMGAQVYGYARPENSSEDLFYRLGLRDRIDHTDGDICDPVALEAAFDRAQPEVVFHLAAQALVRDSYVDPVENYNTNLMGSVQVLEAVRRHHETVRSFIYVTSDKCYQNNEWVHGYREEDRLGGKDPYSASKAAAELIFASYRHSFLDALPQLGCASVRAGNVIGGGDWAKDRIVPDTIRALHKQEPVLLRSAAATRPWQHVLEPLSGYLHLAARFLDDPVTHRGAWNFGPSNKSNKTVGALVDEIIRVWGRGSRSDAEVENALHEAGLLLVNCDKANLRLEWFPRWNFTQSIFETVDWYKRLLNGEDAFAVSCEQINRYESEATHAVSN